jgi:hypothetical protein
MRRFIFVGEKPSNRALQIGATWQNGKLAGKTLREGLLTLGINPDEQDYINLWDDTVTHVTPEFYHELMLGLVECRGSCPGMTVIGMGDKVCKELRKYRIPHTRIVHPAARGKIRKTERYQEHLASRLLGR